MRRPTLFIVPIIAMAFMIAQPAGVIGQSKSEDVKKETKEAWEAFKAYMVDKKHEAVEYGKDLLKKADTKIEELEGKAAKASGDAKAKYQKEIKVLKQKRAQAGKKLDELGKASKDGWDAAKEGFANAYKDLYDAYHEAVKKF